MKKKLIFIIPILALLGFLAIKPPAIGSEKKNLVVTPSSTSTPLSQPKLRDFDDDGNGPAHFGDRDDKGERGEHGDDRYRDRHRDGEDSHEGDDD